MPLSADELEHIAPASAQYADQLLIQMARAGILHTPLRAGRFLGQIHVESMGFSRVTESLNYSVQGLLGTFPNRVTPEQARRYGRSAEHPADQPAIAELVYGGAWGAKHLGNTERGDGWRFRGRGLKQLTGRDNYTRFSEAMWGDERAVRDPDMVADPAGAVASAVWFWVVNDLNRIADSGSVKDVTKRVNGGTMGLAERERWTRVYTAAAVS